MARFKKTVQERLNYYFVRESEVDEKYIDFLKRTSDTPEEAFDTLIDAQMLDEIDFERVLKSYIASVEDIEEGDYSDSYNYDYGTYDSDEDNDTYDYDSDEDDGTYDYSLDDEDEEIDFEANFWDNYIEYDEGVYDDDALNRDSFKEDLIVDPRYKIA